MNNNFSFKRLCNLLRLQFTFDGRGVLIGAVGLFGIVSIIYFLTNINNIFANASDPSGKFENSMVMFSQFIMIPIAGFVYMYLISQSFKPYFKRGAGAASMMLPATRLEKFTVALIKLVTAPIAIMLVLMFTDFIWVALVIRQPDQTIFVSISEFLVELWDNDAGVLTTIAMMAGEIMLYFLCSALFRRHTFLMSIIAVSGFHLVVTLLGGIWFFSYFNDIENIGNFGFEGFEETSAIRYVFGIAQLLFVLAIGYITWLRFTRIQISK